MFVVFDYKTITFLVISMIIVLGAIAYFLRDCNCKTGPQGPQGPPGQSVDLSNYKGNVKVTGDIYASGMIKSGDCQLNCNSMPTPTPTPKSSSYTGWVVAGVFIGIFVGVGALVFYKKYGKRLFGESRSSSSSSTRGLGDE